MTTEISVPQLSRETFVTSYAQMRPFREGGNVLQKVEKAGKIIVHNYGHGGAGVSIAPGCAIDAALLVEKQISSSLNGTVAVVGSGIIGLFQAYELKIRFPILPLIVYADRIPEYGQKDNSKMITSEVAPGFWLPYGYGYQCQNIHKRQSTLSLKQYQRLSKLPLYSKFLNSVPFYDIADPQLNDDYYNVLTQELKLTFHKKNVKIGKVEVPAKIFQTYRIDLQPFLQVMIKELKEKGVKFVEKKVSSSEFTEIPHKIVFNCTGLGSKTLLGDKAMRGIKGHLLQFKNPNPTQYSYFIRSNIGKSPVNYYIHDSRIILGLTRENIQDTIVVKEQVQRLLDLHQKVLSKYGLICNKPKL